MRDCRFAVLDLDQRVPADYEGDRCKARSMNGGRLAVGIDKALMGCEGNEAMQDRDVEDSDV